MFDNLPLEIQLQIIKKLPIKSLLHFRSISKTCKSQIDTSAFISHYTTSQTQTHLQKHTLVAYQEPGDINPTYISFPDDDETFTQHKHFPTVPLLVNMLKDSVVIGTSHGLVCLYGFYSKTSMVVLWNLSIRKAVPIVVPNVGCGMYGTVVGFGVCRVTNDPKIVKITYIERESDLERISCVPWQVEVFTLSTRVWRRLCNNNLPRKTIKFDWGRVGVVADGFVYWLVVDRIMMDREYSSRNLVISFDVTTEEFREVNLPDSLANEYYYSLSTSKLRESLVVLQHGVDVDNRVISVWMMEDDVAKSFIKVFSVSVGTPVEAYLRGFRKSGEPILQVCENNLPIYKLIVYDPYSKQVDYLGISGVACTFFVYPYVETLLLLDQPNLGGYNETELIEYLDDLVS
ncbi:hypothetical protein QVD17_09357 [Tagetes erecta]|uniref:F-box domain-containing protein n=1 Tax=Tagetes erecta TaxID=13708 RepID=A0AAD8L765_TARER|nr:hypothetical protein QVD17_09357 [Tagetes erecta]